MKKLLLTYLSLTIGCLCLAANKDQERDVAIAGGAWYNKPSVAKCSRCDLSNADLHGLRLQGADLSRAYLRDANLSGTDLDLGTLEGADLARANLSTTDLTGTNLSGANLTGANLDGAKIETNPLKPGEDSKYRPTSLKGTIINQYKGTPKSATGKSLKIEDLKQLGAICNPADCTKAGYSHWTKGDCPDQSEAWRNMENSCNPCNLNCIRLDNTTTSISIPQYEEKGVCYTRAGPSSYFSSEDSVDFNKACRAEVYK